MTVLSAEKACEYLNSLTEEEFKKVCQSNPKVLKMILYRFKLYLRRGL